MENTELKCLGDNIRKIRSRKKISQATLAEMCLMEKGNLSRIESGLANPTFRTLFRISQSLEVPMARLFK